MIVLAACLCIWWLEVKLYYFFESLIAGRHRYREVLYPAMFNHYKALYEPNQGETT